MQKIMIDGVNVAECEYIEKQFFETFGIEPKMLCECSFKNLHDYRIDYGSDVCIRMDDDIKNPCDSCELAKQIHPLYPKITDRVLLELICVLNDFEGINVEATTIKGLKEELLKQCIEPFQFPIAYEEHHEIDKLYEQVRALFREAGK